MIGALYRRLDGHMQEIVRGASAAFLMKVLAAGVQFAFGVAVARTLGAGGAGIFFLALTILTIASVLGRAGLDNALLRFAATGAAAGDWGAVKALYRQGMSLTLIASGLLAAVLWFSSPLLAHFFHEPGLVAALRWMAAAVVPHALFWLHAELLKGLKRIPLSLFVQSACLPLLALVAVPLLGGTAGVAGAACAYAASALLTCVAGYRFWVLAVPRSPAPTDFPLRELLRSCAPLYIGGIMNLVINWSATLFLGAWAASAEVGIFTAAQRTATLTSFILIAVNSIAAPKFAALYQARDMQALARTARQTTWVMTLAAAPVLALFLLAPGWTMAVFGPEFRSGGLLLSIMALGQFINVATGSVAFLLMMSGHEKLHRNSQLVGAALHLVLCLTLVRSHGGIGAAIATASTLAVVNLLSAFYVWRVLGITMLPGGAKSAA